MEVAMKDRLIGLTYAMVVLFAVCCQASYAGGKWKAAGTFVEGCSCMGVCPCELTGLKDGCEGLGAMMLGTGSSYDGVDLSGVKIVYASAIGQWVRLYVDAPDAKKNKAARDFASSYYRGFGKVEAVNDASIDWTGKDGKYTVLISKGDLMKLVTEPVLGGDGKTPITHTNTHSALNPSVMQGKTVSASYKDGDKSITLEGSNSYFNTRMKSSGAF
jgi:hypothetical protein